MSTVETTELRHDGRCPSWFAVDPPERCTCRDLHGHVLATVTELGAGTCCMCNRPVEWRVDRTVPSCTAHVGDLLAESYAHSDGFALIVVTPVGGSR